MPGLSVIHALKRCRGYLIEAPCESITCFFSMISSALHNSHSACICKWPVVQTTGSHRATGTQPAANAYWFISASLLLSFQRYVCESCYIWSLYAWSAGPLLSVGLILSYLIKEAKSRPSISHEFGEKSASGGYKTQLFRSYIHILRLH